MRNRNIVLVVSLLPLSLFVPAASADVSLPKTAEKFAIAGHTAYLYAAPNPAKGKPWVWYAPALKGLSLVQRKVYFESFLRAGISIAGFDLGEVRGSPASTAHDKHTARQPVKFLISAASNYSLSINV